MRWLDEKKTRRAVSLVLVTTVATKAVGLSSTQFAIFFVGGTTSRFFWIPLIAQFCAWGKWDLLPAKKKRLGFGHYDQNPQIRKA